MQDDLLKIINHYGVMPQLKYFQSEVFELNEAIIKRDYLPDREDVDGELFGMNLSIDLAEEHILEEIADVRVMLEQFIEYYKLDRTEIELIMNKKIKRQLERIDKAIKEEVK